MIKWNNIKWLKVAWYGKNGNRTVNSGVSSETVEPQQRCIYRGRSMKIWQNGKKGSKSPNCEVRVGGGGAEALELYCEGLFKESVVGGVRNARQNRVSPDTFFSINNVLEVTVSMVLLSVPYISSFIIMYQCSMCFDYFFTSSVCHLFVLVDIFIELISSHVDRTEAR